MEKFSTSKDGYNKEEVNKFVNDVVTEVESMLNKMKQKDKEISELTKSLEKYDNLELVLNKTILMAEDSSNQMKKLAKEEADNLINDAKKNASRIVNEALMQAEKTELESIRLKRNIITFKKKLKVLLEQQMERLIILNIILNMKILMTIFILCQLERKHIKNILNL